MAKLEWNGGLYTIVFGVATVNKWRLELQTKLDLQASSGHNNRFTQKLSQFIKCLWKNLNFLSE